MATITLRARGRAGADLAWERYARPELWSTWAPQIVRVETEVPRIVPGASGRVVAVGGLRVSFTVDEVDEAAREWSWTARLGPLRMRLDHGVEARSGGCGTWLRVHGPLPVIAGYAPLASLALRRLVAA